MTAPPLPARARVLDFETSGLPEDPGAAICEIGFVDVDIRDLESPSVLEETMFSTLIDPEQPMRPEISAVHHLIDSDFLGAPKIAFGAAELMRTMTSGDIFVAHNAKFEQGFFPVKTPLLWIDTYRVALRAWPDAPSHSNQGLRYWLESQGLIKVDRALASPPHRALPDAYVTAHILTALLKMGRPLSRLVELSSMPGFLPKVTFGKHYGTKFSDLPIDYLEWMVDNMTKPEDADKFYTADYWLRKKRAGQ